MITGFTTFRNTKIRMLSQDERWLEKNDAEWLAEVRRMRNHRDDDEWPGDPRD